VPVARSPTPFRGRARERAALEALAGGLRRGDSAALVLRGEAGVGKSTLLADFVARQDDCHVAQAAGVEFEMELAYGGLHQLCRPLLPLAERLPAQHRQALHRAFGMAEGAAPDPFFVGLAVLGLLTEGADDRPLICVVDDAYALDRASAHALAFVARRLHAESVGLIFAVRETPPELAGLPELVVEGLGDEDARALLDAAVRRPLDAAVRARILDETRGNPLALLELPRADSAGGFATPSARSLAGRIEQRFVDEMAELPAAEQQLLVFAAADPTGDALLLRKAAQHVGIGVPLTAGAALGRFVELAPRVRFRHPLVRSAVYGSATAEDRRTAHLALGQATDAAADPDRRAWHLAQTCETFDAAIAEQLERSAERARSRGGPAAAGAFLTRAAELTPEPAERARRSLEAATAEFQSGSLDAALALTLAAESGPLDDLQLARAELLHGQIAFHRRRGSGESELLLKAARRMERHDVALARETHLEALMAAAYAGRLGTGSVLEVARAGLAAAPPSGPPRPIDLLLDAYVAWIVDGPGGTPLLRQAAEAMLAELPPSPETMRWMWVAVNACFETFNEDGAARLAEREVQVAREAGALILLGIALAQLGAVRMLCGDFVSADALYQEAVAVSSDAGVPPPRYVLVALAAFRGDAEGFNALAPAVLAAARESGEGHVVSMVELSSALLHNGLGQPRAALDAAASLADESPETYGSFVLLEYVEAAVRCDDSARTRAALEWMEAATATADSGWGRGVCRLAQALAAEASADPEPLYREAIALLETSSLRPYRGRAQLLYGEWLRRQGRRSDARLQLGRAHDLLTTIGCRAFADRAARELGIVGGERTRSRSPEIREQLTPQELQVAQMAASGLSNREIGERLFLSHRTVGSHLYRVYPKLGIASRTQLHLALAAEGDGLT
jgi:DNA-binding CsgD family transcriptional regulator/tetratricopeptide (TPR) repeat protein